MISFPDRPPIHSYSHRLRSRYGETDQMGYVYYGRYLEFFEVARTEMIRDLGLPYSKLEEQGIMLPVVDAALEYKSPVFYDEEMTLKVMIYDRPAVRLFTYYHVYTSRQEDPHVLGQVTLAFSDRETRRPRRAPGNFLDRLSAQSG
ncbi:MAG: thioesterase family protein [Balneolaceae bacterium]